jgi:hypothetical protein
MRPIELFITLASVLCKEKNCTGKIYGALKKVNAISIGLLDCQRVIPLGELAPGKVIIT